jgi:menaquinol-cytochrome c reductase iron-sulfur subunit
MDRMRQMDQPDYNSSRRRFHLGVIYTFMGSIGAALGIPAAGYLLVPGASKKKQDWVEVADIAGLPADRPEEIVFRRSRKDGWKTLIEKTSAWVSRKPDGSVIAFAPSCTHLGCAFHYDEKQKNYLCPCHTSTFDLNGKPLEGPAPRALDRYQTRIEGGKLLLGAVEKSKES